MTARRQSMDPMTLRRIASLFQQLSEVYETLATEQDGDATERRSPTTPKPPRRVRTQRIYVPDDEPSELEVARAKAILKKLGYT